MKKEEARMLKGALKATVAYTVLMVGLSLPAPGFAENTPLPLPVGAPAAAAPATVSTTVTTTTPSSTSSVTATAPMPVPTGMPGALPEPGSGPSPLMQAPATPRAVQDAMAGLQKTDPINLDDMIRAQDAINRLDLLLEIEKRQTELKKLRDERNKPTIMSSSIPASALNLPSLKVTSTSGINLPPANTLPKPPEPPASTYSLKRIVGTEGRYSAVISSGGDRVLSVRPGETLPDGSKVKSVTLTSVSLVKDKKSKTLTIPSDSYIVRGSEELIP
jgi:type IV pilus biogenesis protein PilP